MNNPSAFATLWRAFCSQLLGEASESEAAYRQRLILILTCLIAPAIFILIFMYPDFSNVVIMARFHRAPASIVDDRLEWIFFVLTTYAVVGTGFVTVLAWDSLTFTAGDAMVLGPLPVRPRTMFLAKLAALGTLLFWATVPIAIIQTALFTIETTDPPGVALFTVRFAAASAALLGASLFAFAAVVALRGVAVLLLGSRAASSLGPPLQFVFVLGMMSLIFMSPAFWQSRIITNGVTAMLPSAWFVGLFERLRGSPRAGWPSFSLEARRAIGATPAVVIAALALSALTFRQQCRAALTPAVRTGAVGTAALVRQVARLLSGTAPVARATSDFVLLTLERCRPQQQPIAVNAAVGAAIAIAELTRRIRNLGDISHPRTVTLCVPLIIGYWVLLGLRRAFAIPSEFPATWTFRFTAPADTAVCLAGVRGAVYGAAVLPLAFTTFAAFIVMLGWRVAAWHTLIVTAIMALLTELILLDVRGVPFTRAERPPQTAAPVWWVAYIAGIAFFVYIPGRLELSLLARPEALLVFAGVMIGGALLISGARRWRRWNWQTAQDSDAGDAMLEDITLLRLTS